MIDTTSAAQLAHVAESPGVLVRSSALRGPALETARVGRSEVDRYWFPGPGIGHHLLGVTDDLEMSGNDADEPGEGICKTPSRSEKLQLTLSVVPMKIEVMPPLTVVPEPVCSPRNDRAARSCCSDQ